MPRARGYKLNAVRLSRDLCRFEYRYNGVYVRRTATMDALNAFLLGEVDRDPNMAPGALPTAFGDFANEKYLAVAAKARLSNPKSYKAETYLVNSLCAALGKRPLHGIRRQDAEKCKEDWLAQGCVNNTIRKRLNALRRVLDHAEALGLIVRNPIPPVRGLPVGNRSEIWLRLPELDLLKQHAHRIIEPVIEYQVLTGARLGEALDFQAGDIRNGKLFIPTEKQGRPQRDAMRHFEIASLGPRFASLMARLTPHPKSGFYFYANADALGPLSQSYAGRLFREARDAAGLHRVHGHDLRGTFCQHRAVTVKSIRQLLYEMGHGDLRSIRSYLDRAGHLEPEDSLFFDPGKMGHQPAAKLDALPEAPASSKFRRDAARPLVH